MHLAQNRRKGRRKVSNSSIHSITLTNTHAHILSLSSFPLPSPPAVEAEPVVGVESGGGEGNLTTDNEEKELQ